MHTERAQRFAPHRRPLTLHPFRPLWLQVRACMVWIPVLLLAANRLEASERHEAALDARIQGLVNDLKARLSIPQEVAVAVVPKNPRVASVEPAPGRRDAFVLSLEAGFIDGLSEDELAAVIAHELGHVWIFTHFPYLHTELGANQIAMRVVKRESLERVYGKVWKDGIKTDRARYIGEDPRPVEAVQVAGSPR